MVQFLASIIEWFAVLALSVMGIGYEPPQSCATSEPTEFRQAVVWIPADASEGLQSARFVTGPCNLGTELIAQDRKTNVRTPSDRYNG